MLFIETLRMLYLMLIRNRMICGAGSVNGTIPLHTPSPQMLPQPTPISAGHLSRNPAGHFTGPLILLGSV